MAITNKPASNDLFTNVGFFNITEDFTGVLSLNVRANDSAGSLWSLDDGINSSVDLLVQDTARSSSASSDRSANGARIWITTSGNVGYDASTLSSTFKAKLQSLAVGETLDDTFTYAIRLANGNYEWATTTVRYAGANDVVTITSTAQSGTVTEDANTTPSTTDSLIAGGTITFNDVDLSDTHTATVRASSSNTTSFGVLTLGAVNELANAADGSVTWQYTLNNSLANSLAAGQTVRETYIVTVSDGKGSTTTQNVVITIVGTNDAAVITGQSTGSITETNAAQSISGKLNITDVDNVAAFVAQSNINGSNGYGKFSINSSGLWTYTMNNAQNQLVAGQTYTDTVTVRAVDGTTQLITVTLTGTNDAATINGTSVGTVVEAGGVANGTINTPSVTGTLTANDVDNPVNTFNVTSGNTTYGSFSITSNGIWTYNLNNGNTTVQSLNVSQTLTDSFTVSSIDGTTKVINITIRGANDAAVIGGTTTATLNETDAAQTTTGTLTVSDVDSAANFVAQTNVNGSNGYGKFSINAAGVWTYTMNNAQNQFVAGQTYTDSITVKTSDNTTQVITVTINGTNDAAVISGSASGTVVEAGGANNSIPGTPTATGTLTSVDVDNPANTFAVVTIPANSANGYGKFTMTASGTWTYTLDNTNPVVQALKANQTTTDSFIVTSIDGTPKTISITINGTNDLPTISGDTSGSADETNAPVTISGVLSATDVDNAAGFQAETIVGSKGSLSIDAAGNWSFVANSAYDNLNVGDSVSETFTVKTVDGTTQAISITINGTNDLPTISGDTSGSADETNAPVTISGVLSATDVDNAAGFQAETIVGSKGSLSIDAAGNWSFVANSAYDNLNVGDSVSETFTVKTVDGTTQAISITINGTNDLPTISGDTSGSADETNAPVTISGVLSATDVDNAAGFQAETIVGSKGSLSIDAAGNWSFVANSAYDNLNVGDSVSETFTVKTVDGTTQAISITINGTNDLPTISGDTSGSADETNAPVTISGVLSATDVDNAAGFQAETIVGSKGSLSIDAAGNWSFVANSAYDNLNVGDSVSETFTVKTVDGTTQAISITINGTNDLPTISGDTSGSADETNAPVTISGVLSATDVDNAAGFQAETIVGSKGSLSIDAAGNWSFVANSAYDNLNVGDSVSETFTVKTVDGTTQAISITINGTNDLPTISGDTSGSADETNAPVTISGVLSATDVDNAAGFQAETIVGSKGSLSIDAAGNWSFVANSAYDNLNVGDSVSETFTVKTVDGTTQAISITINGTNDLPTISGDTSGSADETNAPVTISGVLSATDVDNAAGFQAETIVGSKGSLSIDAAGNWSFVANSAYDNLNVGDSVSETFTVKTVDGTTQAISITINGTNDLPTISGDTSGSADETNAPVTISGVLSATDVDNAAGFQAETIVGSKGSLSIDAAGNWSFVANSAYDNLNVGDSVSETFTVKTVDGTTQAISITINGTNDLPTISGDTSGSADETNAPVTISGVLSATDVDNAAGFQAETIVGSKGSLSIDAAGNWSFVANSAYDNLNVGDSVSETFTVKTVDGTTQAISITINGTNDLPTISGDTSGSADETNAPVTISGVLSATDVDNAAGFQAETIVGSKGSLSIDAAGNWSFVANSAYDNLNVGDSVSETFTVKTVDGTTQAISITINGTNDLPTISGDTSGSADETNAPVTISGVLSATDVDNAAGFQAETIVGSKGSLSIDAAGNWSFVANSAYDNLNVGDSVSETFTVKTVDGTTQAISITINGTNDLPTISGDTSGSADETNAPVTISGVLSATDVDNAAGFQAETIVGSKGSLSIDAAGNWSFVANSAYDNLNVGDSVSETFTVKTVDGTTQAISITINGTNDLPTISGDTSGSADETNAPVTISGVLSATDVDNAAGFQAETIVGSKGSLSIDAAGNWSFVANSAYDNLNVGDSVSETFTVKTVDGTTQAISITINGTNDLPTISGDTSGSADETNAPVTISGVLSATDVDNAAGFQAETIVGSKGSLSIDAAGNWSFVANSAYDNLNVGDSVSETFTVKTVDGTTQAISITINGTNDLPTISGDTSGSADETNAPVTISGVLSATDVDNAAGFQAETIVGSKGSLSIDAAGNWSFVANSAYDNLNVGDSVSETFTVKTVDGTTQAISITINGTNDLPTISGDTSGSADETNAPVTISGVLSATDVDNAAGFQAETIVGSKGSLSIDAAGNWSFVANSAYDNLNVGDSVSETFTVKTVDGTTQAISITINGTNDLPTISGDTSGSADETNAPVTISGVLSATDVDNAAGFQAETIVGSKGSLSIDAAGNWSFVANSAYDNLNVGDSVSETFTVKTVDGTTQAISITINGTNDLPTISGDTSGSADETNAPVTISGVLSATDVDNAAGFQAETIVGSKGSLSIDAAGNWSFVANSAYDNLNVGDSVSETFTVKTVDGTTQAISITINGTNDLPTISGDTSGSADETNAPVTISGVLSATDVDNAAGFQAETIVGSKGSLSIDAAGNWSFVANSAYDNLNVGDSVSETFTVKTVDGTTQAISITINGTNDLPTISGDTSGSADETNAPVTISGVLSATDVDNAAGFQAETIVGSKGSLSIDAAGNWSFVANSAYDNLNVGDSVSETFTVKTVDGTTQAISITINGTNDLPTISGDTSGSADETNAPVTISGVLSATDVDNAAGFQAETIVGSKGSLSIDAAGNWSFVANSAYDNLNVGDSVSETFTVKTVDGTTQAISITINGTNDLPTISGDTSGSADETNAPVTISGVLSATDVDNAAGFQAETIVGSKGSLSIDAAGNWSFVANSAYDNLNVGDSVSETFTVKTVDGTTQAISITINGTNDLPTISGDTSGSADETNAPVTISGVLSATDVDNAAGFQAETIVGSKGSLSIDAAGNWSFVANSAYDNLNVGDSVSETFTVKTVDGTTQAISITINGTNDAPVISTGSTANVDENVATTTVVYHAARTDVDSGDTATWSLSGADANLLSIDSNGDVRLINSANFEAKATYSFNVVATDSQNATDTKAVTLTINDVNEAPTAVVLSNVVTTTPENGGQVKVADIAVTDDALGTNTLSLSGADAASFSIIGNALYFVGGANFEAKTSYSVSVNVNDATVGVNPDASTNYTLNITDVNEAPTAVVLSNVVTSTPENGGQVKVADIAVTDDALGTNTLSLSGADAASFSIIGNALYFVGGANFEAKTSYSVSVNVDDATVGGNPDASTNYTLNITNVNEAPVAVNDTGSATEAGGTNNGTAGSNATGNVLTNDTDVDTANSSFTVTAVRTGGTEGSGTAGTLGTSLTGTYGTLTLNANGTYTYVVNNSNATVQALKSGDTLTDSFNYTMSDGSLTDTAVLNITINGANDAPVAVTESIYTNVASGGSNITLKGTWLTRNDTDVDSSSLTVSAVSASNIGSGSIASNVITLTNNSITSGNSSTFSYTVSDGSLTNTVTDNFIRPSNNNTITASTGNDIIVETRGGTAMTGDAGFDVFSIQTTVTGDTIADLGNGGDALVLASGASVSATVASAGFTATALTENNGGTATLNTAGFNVDMSAATGTAGYTIVGTTATAMTLTGSSFADTITGSTGADTINGGAGNDTISGGTGGADTLIGGAGNDTITYRQGVSGSVVTIHGDAASAAAGTDTDTLVISLTSGSATIDLSQVSDQDTGNSFTTVTGFENITGTSSSVALTLTGSDGANTIIGGSGADIINGGLGNDTLTGNGGSDTFRFTSSGTGNADTITDFTASGAGSDKIALSKAVFTAIATSAGSALGNTEFTNVANGNTANVGANVRIIYDQTNNGVYYDSDGGSSANRTLIVTLTGVTDNQIDATDFNVIS